jgi:hypothetical protein
MSHLGKSLVRGGQALADAVRGGCLLVTDYSRTPVCRWPSVSESSHDDRDVPQGDPSRVRPLGPLLGLIGGLLVVVGSASPWAVVNPGLGVEVAGLGIVVAVLGAMATSTSQPKAAVRNR